MPPLGFSATMPVRELGTLLHLLRVEILALHLAFAAMGAIVHFLWGLAGIEELLSKSFLFASLPFSSWPFG